MEAIRALMDWLCENGIDVSVCAYLDANRGADGRKCTGVQRGGTGTACLRM